MVAVFYGSTFVRVTEVPAGFTNTGASQRVPLKSSANRTTVSSHKKSLLPLPSSQSKLRYAVTHYCVLTVS